MDTHLGMATMVETELLITTEADAASPQTRQISRPKTLAEMIKSHLESLKAHHLAVMETGDVEAIHKMRVTTRRLQASLDLLLAKEDGSAKDKPSHAIRKLKRLLRSTRRMLSLVRNYDVFLMTIEKEIAGRSEAHRRQYDLLKDILNTRRERLMKQVRRHLRPFSADDIAIKFGFTLVAPQTEANETSEEIEKTLDTKSDSRAAGGKILTIDENKIAERAADRLEQRVGEFQALVSQAHPTIHPEELHQVRIAAKRVRYLLEVVSEMGFGDASRALVWLRTLQDRIGDWHDLQSLEVEIVDIVSRRKFMLKHLSESSHMLQAASHLQRKKNLLIDKIFPIRVTKSLTTTHNRLIRALRRSSVNAAPPEPAAE
jgi:CHAD domain-containing protein